MNCLTAFGEASRMTQFKDKTAKGQNANVGLFTYPMLMAADILMYDAAYVPVGEDQRQHLEITRDLAERFNTRFGPTLAVPEPYILKESAKIMELTDPTSKMSGTNSPDKGLLLLSDEPNRLRKKIMSAVTDTETEIRYDPETKAGVSNLLVIHSVLTGTPVADLETEFAGRGYGDLKKAVAEVVLEAVGPFRSRMAELLDDPAELDRILARGAERAAVVAAGDDDPRPGTPSACCRPRAEEPARARPRCRRHHPRTLGRAAAVRPSRFRRPDGRRHPAARDAAAADGGPARAPGGVHGPPRGRLPRGPSVRDGAVRHRDLPAGLAGGVRPGLQGDRECERLESAVRGGPVERTLDFPYHPHVTIAHHLDDDALDRAFEGLAGFRCAFTVASIELYHHDPDGVWRVIRSLPLGG